MSVEQGWPPTAVMRDYAEDPPAPEIEAALGADMAAGPAALPPPRSADSLDATLAAMQRLAQRTFAGTTCDVVSYSMPAQDGTFRAVWHRPKPPPPPQPSAWKFWRW